MHGLFGKVSGAFGCLMAIAWMIYGVALLVVGWIGINEEYGYWWAAAALIVSFVLRFTLPITYGAILGAMSLWGWHWIGATLFALPGLIFMVPALLAIIIGLFSRR